MKKTFDLIVIGTGAAAAGVASRCRRAGWSVAIIDSLPYGGTCALRGCDPKKVLVGATEALDWVRRPKDKGILADGAKINWSELMRFKHTIIAPLPESNEKWLQTEADSVGATNVIKEHRKIRAAFLARTKSVTVCPSRGHPTA